MMIREKRVLELLRKEVASKSLPPAIIFAVFSIMIFFYRFNISEYKLFLQAGCLGVIMASGFRFVIAKKMLNGPTNERHWKWIKVSVWLNTLSWSTIFAFATYELQCNGPHYCVLVLLLTCFTSSSIITLSYDKWLFIPFQIFLIVPQILIASYYWSTLHNSAYMILSFVYLAGLGYQLKQYKEFRAQLLSRFGYQADLEDSLEELQLSKNELVNKTISLIQISKVSALGEMAGGLSHEVNNSLQVILGSIQQLERNMKTESEIKPTHASKINVIRNAVQKIKDVVEGLRYFSRQMDVGSKEAGSLQDIVSRSLSFSEEFLRANSVDLQIAPIPNVTIYGLPIQLTQIIYNLIKNAYDAVAELDEKQRWIRLSFSTSYGKVLIKVQNGGPSISPEIVSKLFQPFFTTKDVGLGTGLSLSASLGMAREHNGDLYLDETSKNTTFCLLLPCEDREFCTELRS